MDIEYLDIMILEVLSAIYVATIVIIFWSVDSSSGRKGMDGGYRNISQLEVAYYQFIQESHIIHRFYIHYLLIDIIKGGCRLHFPLKGVVARNAFQLEFSELHIFSCSMGKLHLWSINLKISIFYHVVLKILRIENHIFMMFATNMAVLFSQKRHAVFFIYVTYKL